MFQAFKDSKETCCWVDDHGVRCEQRAAAAFLYPVPQPLATWAREELVSGCKEHANLMPLPVYMLQVNG